MARCGCAGNSVCNCLVTAGPNVTVTGTGQAGDPYVISANAGTVAVDDTPTLDLLATGTSPVTITGNVKVDPAAGNLLTIAAGGLRVDCTDVATCGAGAISGSDTDTVDTVVAGSNVSANVLVDSTTPGNLITVVPGGAPGGLRVDCDNVITCFQPGTSIDDAALALGIISVCISGDAGNQLSIGSDGCIFVPAATATNVALQVLDTPSVDMTLTGDGSIGNPWIISATTAAGGAVTVTDTPSVNLTMTGSDLTADVIPNPAAAIAVTPAGVGVVLSSDIQPVTGATNQLTFGTDGGLLLFPECYPPRMTRAEALARRAAGTFNENCHVVITDAPVIGCPGNQSPTEVELHPNTPSSLALEGRMTPLAYTIQGPWDVQYDIDLNAYIKIEDDSGNVVEAEEGTSDTMTEFPFGFPNNVRSNHVNGGFVQLVGWCVPALAGTDISNNVVDGRSDFVRVDLTGLTSPTASLYRNEFRQGTDVTITSSTPVILNENEFYGSGVANIDTSGTTSAIVSFNKVFDGGTLNLVANAGTLEFGENEVSNLSTLNATMNGASNLIRANKFTGRARADISFNGAGVGLFDENHVYDAFRMQIDNGVGNFTINANNFRGADTTAPGVELLVNKPSGFMTMDQNNFDSDSDALGWQFSGAGTNDDLRLSTFYNPTVATPIISTGGPVFFTRSEVRSSPMTLAGAGGATITASFLESSTWTQNGAGRLSAQQSFIQQVDVDSTAGSTKGLTISDSNVTGRGVISQQRSAGAGNDLIGSMSIHSNNNGPLLTLTGAGGTPGAQTVMQASEIGNGSQVTITDPTSTILNSRISAAQVTSVGNTGIQSNIDISAGPVVNLGSFPHNQVVIAGGGVATLTASNNGTFRGFGVNTLV